MLSICINRIEFILESSPVFHMRGKTVCEFSGKMKIQVVSIFSKTNRLLYRATAVLPAQSAPDRRFAKFQTLFLNLSQYKIFQYFMHMRAKTTFE